MAGIPTLTPETTTLQTLRKNWLFTLLRVQNEPLAPSLVAPLVAFRPQWDAAATQATALSDGLLGAKAGAVAADHGINDVSDQTSVAIHEGKKPDLSLPLHQLYFGSRTPSEAKRPTLGTQLELMKPWPALLAQATQPALLALAPSAKTAIAAADLADTNLKAAQAADDKFHLDGELMQLFAAYNALAATTFAALKAIRLAHPELRLPADWAESFFLHESRNPGPTTVKQADMEVQRLQAELAAAQQLHTKIKDEQAVADAAAAAQALADAAVATAKQETAAAKQKEKDAIEAAKKAKKKP